MGFSPCGQRSGAVVSDGFHRAAFHGLFAESGFLVVFGLLVNVGVATVFVASEVGRGSLTAEVTIYTLVIHIIFTRNVLWVSVLYVGHNIDDLVV